MESSVYSSRQIIDQAAADYPLSYTQRWLWFLHQYQPDDTSYHIPFALRISGPLHITAMERSLNTILDRHAILRATVTVSQEEPRLTIRPYAYESLLQPIPLKTGSDVELVEQIRQEINIPMHLDKDPLYRIRLYETGPQQFVLLIVFHHFVFDGWSTSIFMQEMQTLYRHYMTDDRSGAGHPLPELDLQYMDYAAWQREQEARGDYQPSISYWKSVIQDPTPTRLFSERVEPSEDHRGAKRRFLLGQEQVKQIQSFCAEHKITLFMFFLAVLKILVYKYSGQRQVRIGSPISNRGQIEYESLIGNFSNTLLYQTDVRGEMTVRELLHAVRYTSLQTYEHQEVPYERIVAAINPDRQHGTNPLFEIMLVFQNQAKPAIDLGGVSFTQLELDTGTSKFDLTMSLAPYDEGIDVLLEYRLGLLSDQQSAELERQFQHLIAVCISRVDDHIGNMSLIQHVKHVDQPAIRPPVGRRMRAAVSDTIPALFEQAVYRYGSSRAVSDEAIELTYDELNRKANQLARWLRERGVDSEDRIGIYMSRSVELIVAILAVLKAGGTYVPIDTNTPQDRIDYILNDSGCKLVVTDAEHQDQLKSVPHLAVDGEEPPYASMSDDDLLLPLSGQQAAYIIYTSGSTGAPKGVVVEHRNVAGLFQTTQQSFRFSPEDVWTLFHSYAFDFSVWEIWGALLYGGKLVVVPYWTARSPDRFIELIECHQVTILNQTPAAFAQLIEHHRQRLLRSHVRAVIFGGELLADSMIDDIMNDLRRSGGPQFINMYGITEITVHATEYWLQPEVSAQERGKHNIGRPLQNMDIFILDEDMQQVPVGTIGEIYVAGSGVARGYHGRPELTAERFVPHPFSSTAGARLYRSGDLGAWLPNGDIQYFGRIDHQVKVNGYRIELGEIRSAIEESGYVHECVVAVKKDRDGSPVLVAYVRWEQASVDALRAALQRKLPLYMIPSFIVSIDHVPLTDNGKIDIARLPDPAESYERERPYRAPESELEKQLASIWREVLEMDDVSVYDNFFSIGGDSIKTVKIVSLAKASHIDLQIKDVFEHQTIAELATILQDDTREITSDAEEDTEPFELISEEDRVALPPGTEDAYPLTKLQEGMFYHMKRTPQEPLYHNVDSYTFRLRSFDIEQFRSAWQTIVDRHPIFRTYFEFIKYSQPLQIVQEHVVASVGYEDIAHLSEEEQQKIVTKYVRAQKKQRFDLRQPPLLRFMFHKLGADRYQFTMTECHMILDGWSLTSTLAELFELYDALHRGLDLATPPLIETTFRDYVHQERRVLGSDEAKQFWRSYLQDATVLELPSRPTYDETKLKIRRKVVRLGTDLSERLTALSTERGVPMKHILLTAHTKVLSILSGTDDIVTGLVANGRLAKLGGDQVRGLFLNTVPFRLTCAHGSWVEQMDRSFRTEQSLYPYRQYPLSEIQRLVGVPTLFTTAFNYVYFYSLTKIFEEETVVLERSHQDSADDTHYDLMAAFSQHPPTYEIALVLAYNEHRFSQQMMNACADLYTRLLQAIAYDPYGHMNARSWISEQAIERIKRWNRTSYARRSYRPVYRNVERIAASMPDHIAVIHEQDMLTYQELNSLANQVARMLRRRGVRRGDPVGICVNRSHESIVYSLAVLKAGGVYVPLDPAHPAVRQQHIVRDARVRCIIVDAAYRELFADLVPDEQLYESDRLRHDAHRELPSNLRITAGPDELAYILYTSGSTGQPKGVMVTHAGLANRLRWMQRTYEIDETETILHKTSIGFDVSIWEIFWPIMTGAKVVVAKQDGQKDARYIQQLIDLHSVTYTHFVPSMLSLFIDALPDSACRSLTSIICSGEPLTYDLFEKTSRILPAKVYNLYGPTEASIDVTAYECKERVDRSVPIGRPIDNTQVYVLDDDMNHVMPGVPGELYIGGIGLARGYVDKPHLTAASFVPDPYASEPGQRLYRTGDIGRYLPNGEIEYIGRRDDQVKIRGNRVELDEIATIMREHPSVHDVVVRYQEVGGHQKLIAYIVYTQDHPEPSDKEWRDHLKTLLPIYMVPDMIMPITNIPVTANGKLDKAALHPDRIARQPVSVQQRPVILPTNSLQQTIMDTIREVMGDEPRSLEDTFMELGVHSLAAMQIIIQLEKQFGVEFPFVKLESLSVLEIESILREGVKQDGEVYSV